MMVAVFGGNGILRMGGGKNWRDFKEKVILSALTLDEASSYLECWKHQEGDADFETTVQHWPADILAHPKIELLIATLYLRKNNHVKAQKMLQNLLGSLDIGDVFLRKKALFALGAAYAAQDFPHEAMKAFKQANALAADIYGQITGPEQSDVIDLQHKIKMQGGGVGRNPIFVIGFPRSGTSIVDQVLSTHAGLRVYEETDVIDRLFSERMTCILKGEVQDRCQLQQAYFDCYRDCFGWDGVSQIVDRSAPNMAYAGFIRQLFPEAPIVYLSRHPLDTCLSCFMQDFKLNRLTIEFTDLTRTVATYKKIMGLLPFGYPPQKTLALRYEDLILRFDATTQTLFNFLGLHWTQAVRDFYKSGQKASIQNETGNRREVKPLYHHGIDRWKGYVDYLQMFEEELAPFARQFGYMAL